MFCPTCGAQNPQDALFCGVCGENLQSANTPQKPETAAADTGNTSPVQKPAVPNPTPAAADMGNAGPVQKPAAPRPAAAGFAGKAQDFLQPAVKQLKTLPLQKLCSKKVLAVALAAVLVLAGTLTAVFYKSDEDKIFARLDDFATAFNEGDSELLLACMSPSARSGLEGAATLGSGLLDAGTGIGGGSGFIWALWSLGVQDMAQGTDYVIEVYDLTFTGDTSAEATIVLTYGESNRDEGVFELIKQDGDWYLADVRSL